MKASRILTYAISGVIAGLLLENGSLRVRQALGKKVREIKQDATRKS